MSDWKKRLAILLCVLTAFTSVIFTAPADTVQAASKTYLNWSVYPGKQGVLVKKNARDLYMGDYVSAYLSGGSYKYYEYLTDQSGVTYISSKPSVLSVNKKTGKASAKKTGTATVTVKFKGASSKVKIKVVSSLKSTVKSKNIKDAQKLIKAYGKGITSKNRYAVLSAYNLCSDKYMSGVGNTYQVGGYQSAIESPTVGHARMIIDKIENYGLEKSPFATSQGKYFKIRSITGKSNKITLNLKSKVTEDQIFGIQYSTVQKGKVSNKSKVSFPISIVDQKTKRKYNAQAVATKGSGKIMITTKGLKLKKGAVYSLYHRNNKDWLYKVNTKFKAS